MRTLVLTHPGTFDWLDVSDPVEGPHDVLVRVLRCGVCGTDRHAFAGRQPFLTYPCRLGHELGVQVVSAPEGSSLSAGDKCAVDPYRYCGSCVACQLGKTNCCESMQVLGVHTNGGHAPLLVRTEDKLYRSDSLSVDELTLVEPLVIGRHAVVRSGLEPGESALVVGQGPIGAAVALYAKEAGAELVVADVRKECLEWSRRFLGVSVLDAGMSLQSAFGGELPRVVFDATGNPEAMHASFDYPGQGGRLVFVGHFPGDVTFSDPEFHRRELTLLASRNGTSKDFCYVLNTMESGTIRTEDMITHRFTFDETPRLCRFRRHAWSSKGNDQYSVSSGAA